jgi:hypothetical protein
MKHCFVCKKFSEVTPIGMRKIKCREIYLCEECTKEIVQIKLKEETQTKVCPKGKTYLMHLNK